MARDAQSSPPAPPAPGVRFGADFLARAARLVPRLTAELERREGRGAARFAGGGEEFVGHRPYRPGEDLRGLDWNLLARLDRPFVRVTRREAAQRWTVLVDASASMGAGPPGKLQRAAEVATAVAFLGLRLGATSTLELSSGGAPAIAMRRRADLGGWMRALEATVASGERGLGAALERAPRRGTGRLILLGDLFDAAPSAVARLVRPGLEIAVARLLAPDELEPRAAGPTRLADAERGARLDVALDRGLVSAYEEELGRDQERWRATCARHRIRFVSVGTPTPFEDVVAALFAG